MNAIYSAMNAGSSTVRRGGYVSPSCPIGYHVHDWATLDHLFTVRLINGARFPRGGIL